MTSTKKPRCWIFITQLIGKTKIYGKRIGLYVVPSAEAEKVVPAKLKSWWTPKQENRLMAVVECMEVYQQEQKHRKAKIKAELQHDAGFLLIGQRNENFFPNMRVRHGVHINVGAKFLHNFKALMVMGFHGTCHNAEHSQFQEAIFGEHPWNARDRKSICSFQKWQLGRVLIHFCLRSEYQPPDQPCV